MATGEGDVQNLNFSELPWTKPFVPVLHIADTVQQVHGMSVINFFKYHWLQKDRSVFAATWSQQPFHDTQQTTKQAIMCSVERLLMLSLKLIITPKYISSSKVDTTIHSRMWIVKGGRYSWLGQRFTLHVPGLVLFTLIVTWNYRRAMHTITNHHRYLWHDCVCSIMHILWNALTCLNMATVAAIDAWKSMIYC